MDLHDERSTGSSEARERQRGVTVPAPPGSYQQGESCDGLATGLTASPVAENAIARIDDSKEDRQLLYLKGGGDSEDKEDEEDEQLRRQILDEDDFDGFREPTSGESIVVMSRVNELIKLMKEDDEKKGG